MHDIKTIRQNPELFTAQMARRGHDFDMAALLSADDAYRKISNEIQMLESERNELARQIPKAVKAAAAVDAVEMRSRAVVVKEEISTKTEEKNLIAPYIKNFFLSLMPNIAAEDVPDGLDEASNIEVTRYGKPRELTFTPRDHADLAAQVGIDFERAAKVSGARFAYLTGPAVRLHRALGQFMLDMNVKSGYEEVNPPLVVTPSAMFGTGQLPKFRDDLYKIPSDISLKGDATDRLLIPTAEVSLTNMFSGEIIDVTQPIRMTALTPCFRLEAGSAGRDTRGLIRQHQFEKVELVTLCLPEDADAEHHYMLQTAESILEALGLPYRRMLLCAGDMGFSARKTYDLEVWLPGQNTYREISSISQCGDFQARRMETRYRPRDEKGTRFVNTLNGSSLAVGRTLVAVIENYQREDGTIEVPNVLRKYINADLLDYRDKE